MTGVLDYGIGNIGSILNMIKKVGAQGAAVQTAEELSRCDRLILPGVGRFDAGMALLCGELARQGFSVLAVDMDAGHARLSGLLGVRPQACLSEYLAGGVSLLDVIVKTPERGLAFIEGLPPEGAVADIAATAAFRSFLKGAESRFDFVILNAAPAGFCADAGMLGTLEGLTVLAARDGAFTAAELNAVMTNLAEDVRLLKGVVFTMARRTRFDAPA